LHFLCLFTIRFPFGFAMDRIDLFWADFILVVGAVVHEVSAAFAAWPARSFPSTWMLQVGLAWWILSIVSRISLIIYYLDWRLGESTAWIADELSVKT
jgi:hypothetical protein